MSNHFAEVQSVEHLTPSMIRIVLANGTLDSIETPSATDAYINAQFVPSGSPVTVPFDRPDVQGLPGDLLPKPRRYSIRRWDPVQRSMTIDFVAHGESGYAGPWAQRAQVGDRLQFKGPGGSYQPSQTVDWHLLVGDESALGAIGSSLETLPVGRRALVFVVVDGPEHELKLPTRADATVTWLHRSTSKDPERLLADAVAAAEFPDGEFDTFVHGEAAEVRAVRLHLITARGVDPAAASISPYWRRDHTDERWRQVKRQWMADQARDAQRPD